MEQILVINDSDLGLEEKKDAQYKPRTAARAVIVNGDKTALLHVTKHNYFKLPGGGVEEGETISNALAREVLEETGCTIKILNEIGEILEHRSQIEEVQTSHCFLAQMVKEGKPNFDKGEIEDGFELVWISLDKAIELIEKSEPTTYDGKFIVVRDLKFLKAAKNLIHE